MVTKKTTTKKKTEATLGEVVMVYTKGSSHWYALVQPQVIEIEGVKFLEGKQVTGKEGHRMEGKRTLIPFDLVSSLVEFQAEDDLWSAPQPKFLPPADEAKAPVLTSHEHGEPGQQDNRRDRNRRRRNKRGNDARFQEQYDSKFNRNFNR